MRHYLVSLIIAMSFSMGAMAESKTALVIHGGAGVIKPGSMSSQTEAEIRRDLNLALDAGNAVLSSGGSALDAVIAAIRVLEESPHFNAGKGAVFNADGEHELDASIMEGHTLRSGAVAGVMTVRSPIMLAHRVMDSSPHVLLAGRGADRFADQFKDIERVENSWFDTPRRRQQLEEAKLRASAKVATSASEYFGTVGAVALDQNGHIAAGTSTGGMTNKQFNRVGDSPLIGAGTYANEDCGFSGTGWGEFYIRAAAAHAVCARVSLRADPVEIAAEEVINQIIPALGGNGGAIAMDKHGNIAMPFNTEGMYRGWVRSDGQRSVALYLTE